MQTQIQYTPASKQRNTLTPCIYGQHTYPKQVEGIPLRFLWKVLKMVMDENVFKFGNNYFIQIKGTAMGTSVAKELTTTSYGWHEKIVILKTLPHIPSHIQMFRQQYLWTMAGPKSTKKSNRPTGKSLLGNKPQMDSIQKRPTSTRTHLQNSKPFKNKDISRRNMED